MNCKRKSRRRFFLLMRSRTSPISSEFRGGGVWTPQTTPSVRHCCRGWDWVRGHHAPAALFPGKDPGGWVGPRCVEEKMSCPHPGPNPKPSSLYRLLQNIKPHPWPYIEVARGRLSLPADRAVTPSRNTKPSDRTKHLTSLKTAESRVWTWQMSLNKMVFMACFISCIALTASGIIYPGADKSLARPTSRCILFDGEGISFDDSLVIYINSTKIPPIMIINRIYESQNLLSL